MINSIITYCAAHHTDITYARMPKPFSTLTINGNNCLYCNRIIVYKLDFLIDVLIFKILI